MGDFIKMQLTFWVLDPKHPKGSYKKDSKKDQFVIIFLAPNNLFFLNLILENFGPPLDLAVIGRTFFGAK